MEKEIFIIRHGQTDYNNKGIIQGSGINSVLNDTGKLQAGAFFETYNHQPFELVITSELQRTHQTVAGFLGNGIPWVKLADINEISWGKYEGMERNEETIRVYDEIVSAWKAGDYSARPEAGESAEELSERLQRFIDLLKERPESRILVCTHGRTLRCLMCMLEGRDISNMDEYAHENTGLYKVHYRDEQFQVSLKNDLMHLAQVS